MSLRLTEGRIFHLALASELAQGSADGRYRPARLLLDGFVHCAPDPATTLEVARSYFADAAEPVVVLEVDVQKLTSVCVLEAAAPLVGGDGHRAGGRLFPHVYGPLDLAAVKVLGPLVRTDGGLAWPR